MNVREANEIIAALNRLAEEVTTLAGRIEQAAWEQIEDHAGALGARPIAAAQLAVPYTDEVMDVEVISEELPLEQPEAATEPELEVEFESQGTATSPAAGKPVELMALEDVRLLLAEMSRAGMTDQIKGLIRAQGKAKLSQLTLEQANHVYEQAKELENASK